MRPRKNPKHQQVTPEALYADLIKAGLVRIVRRKGKPPLIQWITSTSK